MDLDEVKIFLRVDGNDEDSLIQSLQFASELYLTNTGIIKDYTNDLYKTVVKLLIIHWYENRESFINFKTTKIDFGIETIIYSLKYSQVIA